MSQPQVIQSRGPFSLSCAVEVTIRADPARIWSLLTDAEGFQRWNSTVTRVDGQIRDGERLRIHVPGTDRTFTPTVSGVVPRERMVWTGGIRPIFKGVRTFALSPKDEISTQFMMKEEFSGLMIPLVRGSLPDFGPIFQRYADDLKRAAEH
jgi:hypothetical protein